MTEAASPLPRAQSGTPGRFAAALRSTPVGMAAIVIALIIVFGVLSPNGAFFRISNLSTITLNVAVTMLLAVGVTFVLAAGELDLVDRIQRRPVARWWRRRFWSRVSGTYDQVRVGEYPNLAFGVVAGTIAGVARGNGLRSGQRPPGDPTAHHFLHRHARDDGHRNRPCLCRQQRPQRAERSARAANRLRRSEAFRDRTLSSDRRPHHLGGALVYAARDALRAPYACHRVLARGGRTRRHPLVAATSSCCSS